MGANAPEISKKAMLFNSSGSLSPAAAPGPALVGSAAGAGAPAVDLNTRLKQLINKEPVMLFMKGSPGDEKCGFSRTITGMLKDNNVKYGFFDILGDEEVRQGLKDYSKWPTYPQVYSNGELIGGLDILKELAAEGELQDALGAPIVAPLDERLGKLVNKAVSVCKGENL